MSDIEDLLIPQFSYIPIKEDTDLPGLIKHINETFEQLDQYLLYEKWLRNNGTAWIDVEFTADWDNAGGEQPVQYRKEGPRIFLRGTAERVSGSSNAVFNLPIGDRPQNTNYSSVNTIADVQIFPTGLAFVNPVGSNPVYACFDNITFIGTEGYIV